MQIRLSAVLALAIPASLSAQAVAPAPAPVAPPVAPAVDYSIAIPVPGGWSWAPATGGSEANFANAGALPQVTVRCSVATRRVTISRPATGAAPFLFVWTSTGSRNLPASFLPATNKLIADLSAYDPLLDAIAFSRGRVAFGISGQQALVVPAWAEVARVVEDCRA